MPIKMVTALNIESYVKEYAGGGDEPTVPPDLPDKSNLVLGNTFMWGVFPWVVVHVDESAQECYLAMGEEYAGSPDIKGNFKFSEVNAQNNLIAAVYVTEGQQAALKYIVAGTTSGRLFSPTEEQVASTFDYYRTSKSNRVWSGSIWWTSTATKYVDTNGNFVQSTGERASIRPHCCIDMSLYDSQEEPEEPVTNPEWPDRSQLTLGNTINWANQEWVVSHVTSTEVYLTLKGLLGNSTWFNLQSACTNFANKFTEAQKGCLKSVTADDTSGIVFVATRAQMDGGFSYFTINSRRRLGNEYWTSTENNSTFPWYVDSDGTITHGTGLDYVDKSRSLGFRPSVCIDLTLYNT